MTMFLTNPGRRRKAAKRSPSRGRKRATKRRPPKGFRSWKTYMASIRPGGTKKRRKRRKTTTTVKRVTKRRKARRKSTATATPARGNKMAKRRRKSAPRRKGRRRSSRSSARGIVGTLKRGVMDGVGVIAGEALVGFVSARVPLPQTGPVGVAVNLGVAAGVAMLAGKFAPPSMRQMIAAGAFASAVRDSAAAMGVAIPGLSSYPSLSSYPRASLQGFGPSTEAEGSEPGLNALPIAAQRFNNRTGLPAFAPFGSDDDPMMAGMMTGMVQQYD